MRSTSAIEGRGRNPRQPCRRLVCLRAQRREVAVVHHSPTGQPNSCWQRRTPGGQLAKMDIRKKTAALLPPLPRTGGKRDWSRLALTSGRSAHTSSLAINLALGVRSWPTDYRAQVMELWINRGGVVSSSCAKTLRSNLKCSLFYVFCNMFYANCSEDLICIYLIVLTASANE